MPKKNTKGQFTKEVKKTKTHALTTGFSLGVRAGFHRACADYKWMFLLGVLSLYCLLALLHLLLTPTVLYA